MRLPHPPSLSRVTQILLAVQLALLALSCAATRDDASGQSSRVSDGSEESDGGSTDSTKDDTLAQCAGPATWDDFAEDFFTKYCAACHSRSLEGPQRLGTPDDSNFETERDVFESATAVRVRVLEKKDMPIGFVLAACELELLDEYLDSLDAPACEPQCEGLACGSDGCGEQCGTCGDNERCDQNSGQCVMADCEPDCSAKACGGDGCGGLCGSCATPLQCSEHNQCFCEPQCDGRTCGDDGCGGSCGECADNNSCTAAGSCRCVPDCSGKVCGDDGCGGSCGSCPTGDTCDAAQATCECIPDCSNRKCGDDICGGSCGTCTGALECNTREGSCVANCQPDCSGRVCGDDGCGGRCGSCTGDDVCTADGLCACEPACVGKACGDDGCGGTCGSCSDGLLCSNGSCACTPDCSGRVCGDDGCGGSCGSCDDGQSCSSGQCAELCVPSCDGKACGADGCGGSCGSCSNGQSCDQGSCIWPDKTFTADVFPIFEAAGCADGGCHNGVKPSGDLALTSASIAYNALVGRPATCGTKDLVTPGAADQSYLINKLTGIGMCSGSVMPKAGGELSTAQIDIVRAWIAGGAAK